MDAGTSLEQALSALRDSEARYRDMFNAAADALVLRDAHFRIVDVNPAYLAMSGLARSDVIGRDAVFAYQADAPTLESIKARHREVLQGKPAHTEVKRIHQNGAEIDLELRCVPMQYQGRPHVLYICRDISDRKRAEAALRASEEQYRAIFNAAADALVLRDAAFRIVDVNPAFVAMSGYAREELIGRDSLITNPLAHEQTIRALHQRALGGEAVQLETQSLSRSRLRFDLELRGVPILYRGSRHVLYIGRDISERKRAEAALRASEEQYRAIFNAAQDSMVLRDAEFRIVDVNSAYVAGNGFSREEAIGQTRVLGDDPPEFEQMLRAGHKRVLAGEAFHVETPRRRKDGQRIYLELRALPIQHRGEPHVLYIGRDISERKRVEAALCASEEQYRAIFNASSDGMILRDAEFRVVDVNPAYVHMSGYSREEVLGRDRVVANPAEMNDEIKALHRRALAGESVMIETESINKDGSRFDLELRGTPIEYGGRPHVLYIGRDISERKRAEAALRASEEQYRAIFNATTDALVLRDAQARVVDVNPAFLEMSGYTREEVVGHGNWIFALPELSGRAKEMHGRVIAGESVHFEMKARRKDGMPMDVEMHAVPIRYRGAPHALGMARDITAKKRAEAERAQLEAQLRQAQKMEAIGHLTGGIAHDFNNILTGILGYARLAAERPAVAEDAKLARALEEVELACNRARELIQQMLIFSRGRRGAARAVALAPLVRQGIRLLRSSLPPTLEITAELAGEVPAALLDPVQADQVLMNLCINARDAMQGQGSVRIRLAAVGLQEAICASCRGRVSGTFVELSVADCGPGIPPEVMDRMFEPFFTTKEVGQGTGMGLAIVHGIVHEYGGHVLVESSARGAEFRVLFPAVCAKDGGEKPSPRRSPLAPPRLAGRVLLVDDEDTVASFMRERLQGWGLDVTALSSAAEARDVFSRAPQEYDMVVTDYAMPRMNGLELMRALRAMRPALPLILYSGYADSIPEAQLHIAGVELLHKPIDEAALLSALRRHLHSAA